MKISTFVPYLQKNNIIWHKSNIIWSKQGATWYKCNSNIENYLKKKIILKHQTILNNYLTTDNTYQYFIIGDTKHKDSNILSEELNINNLLLHLQLDDNNIQTYYDNKFGSNRINIAIIKIDVKSLYISNWDISDSKYLLFIILQFTNIQFNANNTNNTIKKEDNIIDKCVDKPIDDAHKDEDVNEEDEDVDEDVDEDADEDADDDADADEDIDDEDVDDEDVDEDENEDVDENVNVDENDDNKKDNKNDNLKNDDISETTSIISKIDDKNNKEDILEIDDDILYEQSISSDREEVDNLDHDDEYANDEIDYEGDDEDTKKSTKKKQKLQKKIKTSLNKSILEIHIIKDIVIEQKNIILENILTPEIRKKTINILSKIKLNKKIILKIEMGIFNATIKYCYDKIILPSWANQEFINIYINKVMTIYSNLKPDTYLKNKNLINKIKDNKIKPEELPFLDSFQLFPERWQDLIDENIKREQILIKAHMQSATEQFTCPRCKTKKTNYVQVQTRSADEPMTTFITCLECGKKWKH